VGAGDAEDFDGLNLIIVIQPFRRIRELIELQPVFIRRREFGRRRRFETVLE
jgi:hypothetical protein